MIEALPEASNGTPAIRFRDTSHHVAIRASERVTSHDLTAVLGGIECAMKIWVNVRYRRVLR